VTASAKRLSIFVRKYLAESPLKVTSPAENRRRAGLRSGGAKAKGADTWTEM